MHVTNPQASPPRPSTLPISEPKPVPTPARRLSQTQDKIKQQQQNLSSSPKNISTVPRSQPINLKRSDHRSSVNSDTITPPAVQFAIGTPPGGSSGRLRSTSGGSLSETPPPRWNVSPNAHQSPLRRSGNSSPVLPSALLPALGSPTLWIPPDNNNHPHILGPRAFTLPEIGATGGLQSLLDTNNAEDQTLEFHAPELPAETLLDREHNETLAKLNFVLALTDCIIEVADVRCSPIAALMAAIPPHSKDHCKRAERLVLLVR